MLYKLKSIFNNVNIQSYRMFTAFKFKVEQKQIPVLIIWRARFDNYLLSTISVLTEIADRMIPAII